MKISVNFQKNQKLYGILQKLPEKSGINLNFPEVSGIFRKFIEIPEISQEEKIEALTQSSERRGIFLDTKTIQFIINNTSRSLSDLLRLIDEIDSFSLKKKKKVTPSLIRELLKVRPDNLHR